MHELHHPRTGRCVCSTQESEMIFERILTVIKCTYWNQQHLCPRLRAAERCTALQLCCTDVLDGVFRNTLCFITQGCFFFFVISVMSICRGERDSLHILMSVDCLSAVLSFITLLWKWSAAVSVVFVVWTAPPAPPASDGSDGLCIGQSQPFTVQCNIRT